MPPPIRSRALSPPPSEPQIDHGFDTSAHAPGTLVPGFYSRPAAVLGRSRLRDPAALRYGDGGGHVSSGNDLARAGAKAVEGRLCAALAPAQGWPLRRKPQSAAALLSIPGNNKTVAA